ncbi:MAG TPA: S9 family peptidase, partial [Dysgonomonas sp.]|nr:S9 family peptidase [Dysgonomonas sp.]
MKKSFLLIFSLFLSAFVFCQSINLKDITEGKYSARGVRPVVSSADGEYYFQSDPQNTKIIKYSYKTGEAVQTVFDVKTARDITISSFQGFLMSPDENRLLVYTNSEPIYRRSFKADYYYFDIRRNLIRKLTANKSKQMSPVFSTAGRMLASV